MPNKESTSSTPIRCQSIAPVAQRPDSRHQRQRHCVRDIGANDASSRSAVTLPRRRPSTRNRAASDRRATAYSPRRSRTKSKAAKALKMIANSLLSTASVKISS
jgi:hypothetical protein